MSAKIGLGFLAALALHRLGTRAVARNRRIGLIERFEHALSDFGCLTPLAQAEENGRPLLKAHDETGIGEEFQMAREARLALREDLRQILDVVFAAGKQGQDAQPRDFAGRLERSD